MNADNLNFAALSTDQLDTLKQFEKEFATKYGSNVLLLAFNQK